MDKNTPEQPFNLFYSGQENYFKTLEKLAIPLRQSARQMSTFIDKLAHQTPTLSALKQSFIQLESVPIKHIYRGLEEVSSHLAKVDFLNPQAAMNTAEFIGFMNIQNQLCTELNDLITYAMHVKN